MNSRRALASLSSVLTTALLAVALVAAPQQPAGRETSAQSVASYGLAQMMPVDPEVVVGTLPNGLRYYVRPNGKPANRVELRLVVKAGSVLEDADQLGLAHFVEHMQFEGTQHFPRGGIDAFLASLGLGIGPDANAGDELRRHAVHVARADRLARGAGPRTARAGRLGARGHVRPGRDRAPARHRAVGMAAAPGRRRAHGGQDSRRAARGIALREPAADRQSRRHPARATRAAGPVLPRLVPPGPDGGDRRRRRRSRSPSSP